MYIVAKTKKDKEFIYNNSTSIKCGSLKVAQLLADHLNKYNEQSLGIFKLNEGETWHFYEVENWENPRYKLAKTRGKISIRENI
jgi:hypothetical protein